MARNTGATVIVPIYPLAPQGTAATVVPAMADLISSEIDQHGAENVSVYGDSAGGDIALAAVQELVRRGDPVPSHLVLISPALDLTLSNPAIQFIDDPILNPQVLPIVPTMGRRPRSHRSAGQPPVRVAGRASADRGVLRVVGRARPRCACPPRQGLGDAGRRLHLHPPERFTTRLGDYSQVARDARRSPRHLPTARHRFRLSGCACDRSRAASASIPKMTRRSVDGRRGAQPDHRTFTVADAPSRPIRGQIRGSSNSTTEPSLRFGHRNVSFEAKRFRHRAVAIHHSGSPPRRCGPGRAAPAAAAARSRASPALDRRAAG